MKIGYYVDWLEVYCLERKDNDMVEYLLRQGYKVEIKPYSTRVYSQVLEVSAADGKPLFTVTRGPLSVKDAGRNGVLPSNACHIKIHNMWCYQKDVGGFMMKCAQACNARIHSISRVDICADFQYFYNGLHPGTLLRGFVNEKYLKINQPHFSLYGTSERGYNEFNGATFGSKNSCVFTRFYCKSIEMQEVKQKNWIVDCWKALEFDLTKQVWRVEFMINAPGRRNLNRNTAEVSEITVEDLCSPTKIRGLFISYAKRYFIFTKADSASRKYNQEQLQLFDPSPDIDEFQPYPKVSSSTTNRTVKTVVKFLKGESMKQYGYTMQQRFDMFSMADKIGIHYHLRDWLRWQENNERLDLPTGEPVKNPFTQVQRSTEIDSEEVTIKQAEIW
jgi:hypothetical protein